MSEVTNATKLRYGTRTFNLSPALQTIPRFVSQGCLRQVETRKAIDISIAARYTNTFHSLWASGYELYDRFSLAYRKFLEGLTATFIGEGFLKAERENPAKIKIYGEARGSPQNVGSHLKAVHPLVRTNPVTGWKSIYAVGSFPQYINELTLDESDELLKRFKEILASSHDLQVRFKWRNENDIGNTWYYSTLSCICSHSV